MTCTHRLPVSTGYASGFGEIRVWCGRCEAPVQPTVKWAERYRAARMRKMDRELDSGWLSPNHYNSVQREMDELVEIVREQVSANA
jgi:hypothetical protein